MFLVLPPNRFWPPAIFLLWLGSAASLGAQEEYSVGRVPSEQVWSVAFAPDGQTFAAAQVNRVQLYQTSTGRLLRTIVSKSKEGAVAKFQPGPFSPVPDLVVALDFSPDGTLLSGCRSDATICLWKMTGTEEPVILGAHNGWVRCGSFSPDGTLFASGGQDHKILLWDIRQRSVKASLSGHDSWVGCIAFSSSGKLLASGSEDNKVKLWDVTGGKEIRTMDGARGAIRCIAFSPDERTLLSGDQRGEVHVWDVKAGREKGMLVGHTDTVTALHVLRDGQTVISASRDQTLRAWDMALQKQIGLAKTGPWQSPESMVVSPDQKLVLCGESWGAIQLFKVDRLLRNAGMKEMP
jgi:WD40 repeat protein